MTPAERDRIIRMAWEDRTTFEEIEERTGLAEKDVIKVMRANLKKGSFRLWRKRVTGRVTKHRKLMKRRGVKGERQAMDDLEVTPAVDGKKALTPEEEAVAAAEFLRTKDDEGAKIPGLDGLVLKDS